MVGEGEEGKMGGGGVRRGVREEGRQRENSGDEATYMYTYIHCMAPYAGCVWVSPCQSATTQSRLTRGQYLLPNRECWQTTYSFASSRILLRFHQFAYERGASAAEEHLLRGLID